ncbi:MAG: PatB family C-S lyase [Pseudomonadota bacterium]
MSFDFDTPLDLRRDHCQKWQGVQNAMAELGADDDCSNILPMWVADMDFAAAPPIRAALQAEIDRGYLGYFGGPGPVSEAVSGWLARKHAWEVDPGIIRYSHGVVAGFATTIAAFTEPGDRVILFTPVYHAFFGKLRAMGRAVHESPLALSEGRYEMDLDALAASLTGQEKVLVLCSPHNPGGRLWSTDEIRAVAAFCEAHDLLMISDEIHMDLTFPNVPFHPAATAAPEVLPRLVVLTAASKGFNIAGGETGLAIIPDDSLRARFDASARIMGGTPNRFGMAMTKAAFTAGDDWSAAVRAYLAENFTLWHNRIGALPGIEVMPMQSTYLSWVNFENTGMAPAEVRERLLKTAEVAPNAGKDFGTGGESWNRFNIAMPKSLLHDAISRIEDAFADLQ